MRTLHLILEDEYMGRKYAVQRVLDVETTMALNWTSTEKVMADSLLGLNHLMNEKMKELQNPAPGSG